MSPLVHLQIIRLPESFSALHAQEGFLPRVYPLVPLQAVGAEESLVALRARVGPDSGVVAQVDGQVAGLREFLATVGALEGLVTRVKALVLQKLGMGEEPFPAVGAEERPLARMRQLVSGQGGFVDETLVALRAAEDVLPGVAALVLLHVALPLEALAAEGAHKGHFLRVDLHVAQQAALVQEPFSALCTDVGPLFLMGALMRRERCAVGEAFPAATGVRLFFVGQEVLVEVACRAKNQLAMRAFIGTLRHVDVLAVRLYVSHQCGLPRKRPAAFRAQVLAVLHVGPAVLFQSHGGLEELSADQAIVAAARLVRQLVPLQRLFEGEPAATLRTGEGLLARVDALVCSEEGLELEALPTVWATEMSFFICDGQLLIFSLRVDLVVVPHRGAEGTLWTRESRGTLKKIKMCSNIYMKNYIQSLQSRFIISQWCIKYI